MADACADVDIACHTVVMSSVMSLCMCPQASAICNAKVASPVLGYIVKCHACALLPGSQSDKRRCGCDMPAFKHVFGKPL